MIELPWPAKSLSPNARVHWSKRAKAARDYKNLAHALCLGQRVPKAAAYVLRMDFYPPDQRRRDDDNLIASMKPARDGIAAAFGIDDSLFRTNPKIHHDQVVKGGKVILSLSSLSQERAA